MAANKYKLKLFDVYVVAVVNSSSWISMSKFNSAAGVYVLRARACTVYLMFIQNWFFFELGLPSFEHVTYDPEICFHLLFF